MSKILLLTDIESAADNAPIRVPVPEWGGDVFIQRLTAAEYSEWVGISEKFPERSNEEFLIRCMVDESGKRIIANHQVGILSAKSCTVILRLRKEAMKLHNLGTEDQAETSKKSEASGTDSSATSPKS